MCFFFFFFCIFFGTILASSQATDTGVAHHYISVKTCGKCSLHIKHNNEHKMSEPNECRMETVLIKQDSK